MLKLATAPTFRATVEVPLPGDQQAVIECEFRHMPTIRLAEFLRAAAQGSGDPSRWQRILTRVSGWPGFGWVARFVVPRRSEASYLCDIVQSWDGVDMPFGPDAAEALCEMYPQAAALIVTKWATELSKLRLGN